MGKITLIESLHDTGAVASGVTVQSNLIPNLEVYGFVNSRKIEECGYVSYTKGVINKSPANQIVCSHFISQPTGDVNNKYTVAPIYDSIRIATSEQHFPLKDLYVPSLVNEWFYKELKKRLGNGMSTTVSEKNLKAANLQKNISVVDGELCMSCLAGDILLSNKQGLVTGIGEDVLVVCRYVHEATGNICYVQYSLDEVFTDSDSLPF